MTESYSSYYHSIHLRAISHFDFIPVREISNLSPADAIQLELQKTLISCCLLRGGSTRLKFFEAHLTIIPYSFEIGDYVNVLNEIEMTVE